MTRHLLRLTDRMVDGIVVNSRAVARELERGRSAGVNDAAGLQRAGYDRFRRRANVRRCRGATRRRR